MFLAFLMSAVFIFFVWLVFFQMKWLAWSIPWAVVSGFFLLHLLLIFLIGVRFVAPYSANARVIQHTIQLVPRLPEPTLVTAVLVENNTPVRKGQPLFQFDRRQYQYKVTQLEAELAKAVQNVSVLKADEALARAKVVRAKADSVYARYQKSLAERLATTGAGPEEDAQKWSAQYAMAQATVREGEAEAERARLEYESQIGGVNTTVASVQAELEQARFYLDNTTLVAPEDGTIVNLQVRPGMVAGVLRIGAIGSLVCDAGRYVLGHFDQEVLKYVEVGQPAEVAFDLYPGQIFRGKVASIWRVNRDGQLLPSGHLPEFLPKPPDLPQRQFGVQIDLDAADQSMFPIGAQGAAAIYTGGGGFAVLRRIAIREYTWLNWLYPLPF